MPEADAEAEQRRSPPPPPHPLPPPAVPCHVPHRCQNSEPLTTNLFTLRTCVVKGMDIASRAICGKPLQSCRAEAGMAVPQMGQRSRRALLADQPQGDHTWLRTMTLSMCTSYANTRSAHRAVMCSAER